jgi:hypothetical protein
MKKYLLIFLVCLSYTLIQTGCGYTDEKFISEGTIEYDVEVIENTSPMADMLPSKMTVQFKDNKSSVEMSAGMGLFSSSFISNPDLKTFTVCLKVLNKKFYTIQNDGEIRKENESFLFDMVPSAETKLIAGYKCNKIHIKPKDSSHPEFDVYYTKDISIKDPNFATPFYMIDGVLMEYQMKKFGFELKFTAKSVVNSHIDDVTFETPADYKNISTAEMNDPFLSLQ